MGREGKGEGEGKREGEKEERREGESERERGREERWRKGVRRAWCASGFLSQRYLVDPASSHMLVSKIKPCMSKYKQLYTVKLRTAHYISNNLFDGTLLLGYP